MRLPGSERRPRRRAKAASPVPHLEQELCLDTYIIDSGWDSVAHRALEGAMGQLVPLLSGQRLFRLSPEQSIAFLKEHAELIGKDPIVVVVDRLARKLENPGGYGVRLCLGMIQDPQRLDWVLRLFARIVNTHAETLDIAYTFSRFSHKLGVQGAVEIIMESIGGGNG